MSEKEQFEDRAILAAGAKAPAGPGFGGAEAPPYQISPERIPSIEKLAQIAAASKERRLPACAPTLDLAAVRAKLKGARGRQYWRGLEELAETPEFQEFLHREFPENASEWMDPVGRRGFLKLMGASLALAGLSGCTRPPVEKIVPYVRQPEEIIPGQPLYFATAMPLSGYATGLLVTSHMGRPTKIEGNPEHPASLGATDAIMQASILTLYDPDRSQVLNRAGRISTWSAFLAAVDTALAQQRLSKGAGLRILTETVGSPTLAWQLRNLLKEFPAARWHQYEPCGKHSARGGSKLAFGEYVETRYHFDKADVILSLDADFLCAGPGHVRYAREFAAKRRVSSPESKMSRFYALESCPTNTGTMADHRLPVRARDVEGFARAVAQALGVNVPAAAPPASVAKHARWIEAAVKDLEKHRGASVVIAGEEQSPTVHALAHAINQALGNTGSTVRYTDSVEANPVDQMESLKELVADMNAGKVEFLVILGGNPVYSAPADLGFTSAMSRVALRARLGLYDDETSAQCHWHIPEAHFLETWSDSRAWDGTVTMQQPLIAPLYEGKSAHEFLTAFTKNPSRPGYDIVREYWQTRLGGKDFEKVWRRTLHDGVMAGTALPEKRVQFKPLPAPADPSNPDGRGMEILFRTDAAIYDGQFANNGWLQELPRPLTKMVWDNAALMAPATAQKLGVQNEQVVELKYEGRTLQAPAWILPGHAEDAVTLTLGYGRARGGRVAQNSGFNAYALRVSSAPWFCAGVQITKIGERYPISITQHHHSMEAPRERMETIVREGTLAEYARHPDFVKKMAEEPARELSIYPEVAYPGNAWGMAVDLNACNGCSACVVACQSENNIPIVGKEQVHAAREMHWIRIDRYYRGGMDNPEVSHQPVMCQHCENAPCEVVCPVAATSHSEEGLNDMVYNRCVGTRYCSNNCPYKVRRFNFFQYADASTPSLMLGRNPNVTVRSRGVMEKCTFCVQRINAARIEASKEGRGVRDGEITPACAQACPSEAIVFGNINDKDSRVARLKAEERNYGLLAELNTRPRTSYLARLRNPNPEIAGE